MGEGYASRYPVPIGASLETLCQTKQRLGPVKLYYCDNAVERQSWVLLINVKDMMELFNKTE